jgi:hypothetical protein
MRTLVAIVLTGLFAATVQAKLVPCAGGRYLVPGEPLTGLVQSAPGDVVRVDGRMVSIASGCDPVKARVRGGARGTKVRARWKSCPGLPGRVQLVGVIVDACRTLSATFVVKKAGMVKPVLGSLSACGDGIWDPDGGEECDGDLGPCGGCNACTCDGTAATTTTVVTGTSSSTTTTPGATTTSTTTGGGGTSTSSSTMPLITTTSTTTTTSASGPDLVPIAWMSPPSAVAGGNLAVQFTVENDGPGAAVAPWYDYVLFSDDLALGNDTAIGTPERVTNLGAGAQYTVSPQVVIPQVAPGSYYLFLHTDGSNAVAEGNEPNNLGGFVLVTVIAPDLIPTAFTAPGSAPAGSSVPVSYTVKNQGGSAAFVPWSDRVVFSTDVFLGPDDATLATFARDVTGVAVNGTYSASPSVALPTVAPGTYYLIFQTDHADQIFEGGGGFETNNIRAAVAIDVS